MKTEKHTVAHSYNSNTWDIEAVEGLGVQDQPWLHSEIKATLDLTLSQVSK